MSNQLEQNIDIYNEFQLQDSNDNNSSNDSKLKEEIRLKRKEQRTEIKRLKKEALVKKQIEINETKNDIIEIIKGLEIKLDDIKSKIKKYKSLKNYNKLNYLKNLKDDLIYNIATYNVKLLKLDETFTKRNMIRLKLCTKTEKGKECKYEECFICSFCK